MPGVAIGRIVHYVTTDGQEKAAIISDVYHDDVVALHVMDTYGVNVVFQVGFSEKKAGHTWHWPEKV
jgi:hypothetical protein